jgi:AraC family transcriptional activator of pobA
MKHFKTISELYTQNGYPPPQHPMLSLVTCEELSTCKLTDMEFTTDFYIISLKKIKSGQFLYGKTKYDHDQGSMSFIKPRQLIGIGDLELTEKGFIIHIHEDFLLKQNLHSEIEKYGYFDYEVNEALHLSPNEEEIIWNLFHRIESEYNNNQDEYTKSIIISHIDSILKYSERFYRRQFINRTLFSGIIVSKFTDCLKAYSDGGQLKTMGLPTVRYMAKQLNISPRYLTDLLKQETGKSALEHIHIFLMNEAKKLLLGSGNTISQTAYLLGFENPPYFSRLFKKEIGLTPVQYKEKYA